MVRGGLKKSEKVEPSVGTLKEGVCAEVRSRVLLGQDDVSFGFVESRSHGVHWFLGNLGRAKWLISTEGQRWKQRGDPDWYNQSELQITDLLRRVPVDVLVCCSCVPSRDKDLWEDPNLKCVIWVTDKGPIKGVAPGSDWLVTYRRVSHNSIGGVTNKTVWTSVATRKEGALLWKPVEKVVTNVLRQIVNPTVGGRKAFPVKTGAADMTNTAEGLLE
mmetsp:Transcript_13266/g.20216  ORF Transcript_13266/g.20216 Transcript_13266/m.20216 type:complete len:217 (-) Transcript_13266:52-702(-)